MDFNSLEEYLLSHIDPEPELLRKIDRETHVRLLHAGMQSGHLQGQLLKMLTHMIAPERILEIGTFVGYSTLCFASALGENGEIHTIEIDDELEDTIRGNFIQSEDNHKIILHIGDALEIIPTFEENSFELVFVDADKRLYWNYFEAVLPKVKTNGFIIIDNTLWYGKVIETVKSNDWATKAILDFNDKLAQDARVEKVILPLRDGLTIARKL